MAQVEKNLTNIQTALNPPQKTTFPSRPADRASPNAIPVPDAPQQFPNDGANGGIGAGTGATSGSAKGIPPAPGAAPGSAVSGDSSKSSGKDTSTTTSTSTSTTTSTTTSTSGSGDADAADKPRLVLLWWLQGIVVLALIPTTLVVAQAIRSAYLNFKAKVEYAKTAKPSTVLFLRVVDDLKRFKISRSPSDTAEDFSVRFLTAVDSGLAVDPDLPGLLKDFMRIYTDDRFGTPEGSDQRRKDLQEISDKIHGLSKTKVS
jgi:hypothetical protein